MNMSLNLLAILVSLAMMITGASGAQPGETVATVSTISNFTLSVDGRSVTLEPTIRSGVQTDGESALFDFAFESHGQELFPIQLAVDNDALTVAFLKCGQGLRIPESALAEQMTLSSAGSAQTAEVMQMFTSLGDFYGAMASMAQLANDPEALKAAQADIAQAVKAAVDRGEGEATILPVEGIDTDAVKYSYQMGNAELCAALEAACAASQPLNDMYNAMMNFYGQIFRMNGMEGLDSFEAMLDKAGIQFTVDVTDTETVDGRGEISVADVVMTVKNSEGALNMHIEAEALDDQTYGEITMGLEGAKDGQGMNGEITYETRGEDGEMEMEMTIISGQQEIEFEMDAEFSGKEDGSREVEVKYSVEAGDEIYEEISAEGTVYPDGSSDTSESITIEASGRTIGMSFDVHTSRETFEDKTAAANVIAVESFNTQQPPEGFPGMIMQVSGSLTQDAGALAQEQSVMQLIQLFQSLSGQNASPVQPAPGMFGIGG